MLWNKPSQRKREILNSDVFQSSGTLFIREFHIHEYRNTSDLLQISEYIITVLYEHARYMRYEHF